MGRVFLSAFGTIPNPSHGTKRTTTKGASGDGFALVIESGGVGEVGHLPEDSVESVSLFSGLRRRTISGGLGSSAGALGGSVGLASVHELIAHELGDDVDVLS